MTRQVEIGGRAACGEDVAGRRPDPRATHAGCQAEQAVRCRRWAACQLGGELGDEGARFVEALPTQLVDGVAIEVEVERRDDDQ